MVEQPSLPQRIWHGLILLLSAAALFGGLSTPAVASACITSTTISNTVINNGCIATSDATSGYLLGRLKAADAGLFPLIG